MLQKYAGSGKVHQRHERIARVRKRTHGLFFRKREEVLFDYFGISNVQTSIVQSSNKLKALMKRVFMKRYFKTVTISITYVSD